MDLKTLFRDSDYIYYIKLINGDSLIGKSMDPPETITESGQVEVFDVMKTALRILQSENGSVSEVMTLAPWLDACDLSTVVSIPADTIIVIATVKEQIARKYQNYVVATSLKDASAEHEAKARAEAAVARANKTADSKRLTVEIPAQDPRKPELLSRESMMEAEMNGDIEELPEEVHDEEPHYRVGNVTYH